MSFVGGGTDFEGYYKINGGQVISTTIDKYVYVTVNHKFDNKIHLRYSKTECVDRVDDLEHNIVREVLKLVGIEKGIEITIISDIPTQGTGLGGSSALAVGVIKALYKYKGSSEITSAQVAYAACHIEIARLESPIGRQDQYATAYGGLNRINFRDKNQTSVHSLDEKKVKKERVDWLQESTMLFYLNGRCANTILHHHKNSIEEKIKVLNMQKMLVPLFIHWLYGKADNEYVGKLITQSWELKKEMTPMATSSKIDGLIASAMSAGALGAKLCGAGGGGFLMVICDISKQQMVRDVLKGFTLELKFNFEKEGAKIIYGS